jgi:hypothetical protein
MRNFGVAVLVLVVACGGAESDGGNDNNNDNTPTGDICIDACPQLATCSSLDEQACAGACSCFKQRWKADAYADYETCVTSCGVTDQYITCISSAAAGQTPFDNGAYRTNCEFKVQSCDSYDEDACDPVLLAVISDATFAMLESCLGLPCEDGPNGAGACVADALFCE